jgi:hypothetical protein
MNARILMTLAATLALGGASGCSSMHGDHGSGSASSGDTASGTSRRADAGDTTNGAGASSDGTHSAGDPSCDNPASNQNSDECKRK